MGGRFPLFWFLMGVIVGAAAALMLAPLRGEELREQVVQTASTEWSRAVDELRKARESLEEAREELEDAQDELDDAVDQNDEAGEEV
jgi:gas vesicle protein